MYWCLLLLPVTIYCHAQLYIYDWPSEIVNVWPAKYNHKRLAVAKKFSNNFGVGECISRQESLYHSHQYSLFRLFYFRLLESEFRTTDPEQANLFFIPYDFGMDCSARRSDGALASTGCPHSKRVVELLRSSRYFQRNNGSDHFLLHSINHMMLYYTPLRLMELYKLCINCTKLSIDVYSPKLFTVLKKADYLTKNWVSIPFPSNYHLSEMGEQFSWATSVETVKSITGVYMRERPVLIAYMGTSVVSARLQKELRLELETQCQYWQQRKKESNQESDSIEIECQFVKLPSHQSHVDLFDSKQLPSQIAGESGRSNLYAMSRLCLMPGGDFPTRKGILDALLAGCVPVTFQLASAHLQMPWHWPPSLDSVDSYAVITTNTPILPLGAQHASKCLIYLPRNEFLRDPRGSFSWLLSLSRNVTFMHEKLKAIRKIANRLQYRMPTEYNDMKAQVCAQKNCLTKTNQKAADLEDVIEESRKDVVFQPNVDCTCCDKTVIWKATEKEIKAMNREEAAEKDAVDVIVEKLRRKRVDPAKKRS